MTGLRVRIRREGIASSSGRALIQALDAELSERYPEEGTEEHFRLDADDVGPGRGAFLVAYVDGRPRACGAVRLLDPSTAEIKRMYVEPSARRRGIGRRLLAALESEARRLGARAVLLETGPRQPESVGLYAGAGFTEVGAFGPYASSSLSLFLRKEL